GGARNKNSHGVILTLVATARQVVGANVKSSCECGGGENLCRGTQIGPGPEITERWTTSSARPTNARPAKKARSRRASDGCSTTARSADRDGRGQRRHHRRLRAGNGRQLGL